MSKAGLLRDPRRRARGVGPADQERVPQAGAEVPSRSQPGGRRSRGEIQGSGGGLRGPRRSREALALRSLRSRRGQRRRRGPAASIRRSSPTSATSSRGLGDIFGFGDIFGGGVGAAARSAAPICATTSRSRSRNLRRCRDVDPDSARRDVRDVRRFGSRGRHASGNMQHVPRHRAASLSAGFSDRRAAVLGLPRQRPDDQQAVPVVPRRRPYRTGAEDHGQDSGRHRHRSAAAPLR